MLKQSGIGITQKPSSSSSSTDSLVSPTNQQHHDNVHTDNSFHIHTLVSDIAIFVLKRDVKLQLTNIHTQLNEPCKMMYHQLDIFTGLDSNCGYLNQIWVQNPHNNNINTNSNNNNLHHVLDG